LAQFGAVVPDTGFADLFAEESYWLTYCSSGSLDAVCESLDWYALSPAEQTAYMNEFMILEIEIVYAQEYAALGYDYCALFGYTPLCSWAQRTRPQSRACSSNRSSTRSVFESHRARCTIARQQQGPREEGDTRTKLRQRRESNALEFPREPHRCARTGFSPILLVVVAAHG